MHFLTILNIIHWAQIDKHLYYKVISDIIIMPCMTQVQNPKKGNPLVDILYVYEKKDK